MHVFRLHNLVTKGDLLFVCEEVKLLCQVLKEIMNFFQIVSCVGERSYDMVSLSQKQTNSPVTTMMVSRSRLGLREGKELGNINCVG